MKTIIVLLLPINLLALEIREAHFDDIQELSLLYHQSWHDTYDIIAPHLSTVRTQENCLQQWIQYYQTKTHFILIALEDKKIVGVIYAGKFENSKYKECASYDSEIDKLYVMPALKNKGIGSQLLKACFNTLRARGNKKTIVLSLTKNKISNKFYEKHGGKLVLQPKVEFNETMNAYGFDLT